MTKIIPFIYIYIYIYILETTKITHVLSIQMSYYLWSSRLDLEDDSSKTIWSQTFSNFFTFSSCIFTYMRILKRCLAKLTWSKSKLMLQNSMKFWFSLEIIQIQINNTQMKPKKEKEIRRRRRSVVVSTDLLKLVFFFFLEKILKLI